MSDDDIKNVIMPAVIYQNPPEQLVAYYARHVYTLAEEAVHVQRSNAQFAADPTGYHILWGTNELAANGKLADWDITAPFVPDTLSCSGTTRRKRSGNRARRLSASLSHFRLPRGHYSRQQP
ncbi:hydrolase [Salmonella enterica subsp. enterica]|uniref:Hydrolase n=1 Tax=Salmonella enterica I TaxID=59201 RepID=A0A447PHK9_SALET|nr:hydrolase [Salmonella enterica subsp. enterica]